MGANHSREASPAMSPASIAARMSNRKGATPSNRNSLSKSAIHPASFISVQEKRPSIIDQLQQNLSMPHGDNEEKSKPATAVFELTEIIPPRRASVERAVEADVNAPAMSSVVQAVIDADRRASRRRSGNSKRNSLTPSNLSTRASRGLEMRGFRGAPLSINSSPSSSPFASPLSSPMNLSRSPSPRAFALTALPSPSTSMINLNISTPGASPVNRGSMESTAANNENNLTDDSHPANQKHKINALTSLQLLPSSSLTSPFSSYLDDFSLTTLFHPSQSLLNQIWSHYTNGMQTSTLPFVSLHSMAGDITARILRHHGELYVNRKLRQKKKMLAKIRRTHGGGHKDNNKNPNNTNTNNDSGDDSDIVWLDGDDIGLSSSDVKKTINRQRLYLLPGSHHDNSNSSIQCVAQFICTNLDADHDKNIRKSEFSSGFGKMMKELFLTKQNEWEHKKELKKAKKLGGGNKKHSNCSIM